MKRIDPTATSDDRGRVRLAGDIQAITEAIESYGHTGGRRSRPTPICRTLLAGAGADVVFNIAEGIAAAAARRRCRRCCELLGIPYTGSDPTTLSLASTRG